MVDIRVKERFSLEAVTMDWLFRIDMTLDEREELQTAARVALGTDKLANPEAKEILPDIDSTDRRGWWGDWQADEIWGGWDIGTKAWLLLRSKIMDAPSSEGSTVERARLYTLAALQPFVDRKVASAVSVTSARVGIDRIDVHATLFRGPEPEIALRYQMLWDNIREPATDYILMVGAVLVHLGCKGTLSVNATVRTRMQGAASIGPRAHVIANGTQILHRHPVSTRLYPSSSIAVDTLLKAPVLLLQCQGNDGTTEVLDTRCRHWVRPYGGCYINTLQYKFFYSSCWFNGIDGHLRCDGHEDFHFGTRDFTIHYWMRYYDRTGHHHHYVLDPYDSFRIYKHSDHTMRFWCRGADRIIGTTVCNNDTWYHCEWSREGSNMRFFLNGFQEGATYNFLDDFDWPFWPDYPYIGCNFDHSNYFFHGWFDEWHVWRGFALHTGNFTPPIKPYGWY